MPTRADWEAATPKCPRAQWSSAFSSRLVSGALASRQEADVRCAAPLRIFAGAWACPLHGRVEFSEVARLPLVSGRRPR